MEEETLYVKRAPPVEGETIYPLNLNSYLQRALPVGEETIFSHVKGASPVKGKTMYVSKNDYCTLNTNMDHRIHYKRAPMNGSARLSIRNRYVKSPMIGRSTVDNVQNYTEQAPTKVGARLMTFAKKWSILGSKWLLSIVSEGYRVPVMSTPAVPAGLPDFFGPATYEAKVMEHVQGLLKKGAVYEISRKRADGGITSSLAGQEEERRTPTMPRSEVRQQMFALHKVQDGKSAKCSSNGAARRFYDFNRSKRWLSAYTNSQGVSKSTTIQTQEQVLSVQLAPLRIVDGSEAVYQGPPPCGSVVQATRYQNYGVLRRFSYPRKLLRPGGTAYSSGHRVIGEAGVDYQQREVFIDPGYTYGVSRFFVGHSKNAVDGTGGKEKALQELLQKDGQTGTDREVGLATGHGGSSGQTAKYSSGGSVRVAPSAGNGSHGQKAYGGGASATGPVGRATTGTQQSG